MSSKHGKRECSEHSEARVRGAVSRRPRGLVTAGALAMLLGTAALQVGCASSSPVGRTETTSASLGRSGAQAASEGEAAAHPSGTELALAVRAEEDDADDAPRGFVLVSRDVVERCDAVQGATPRPDDTMAWLTLMKSVVACCKHGALKGHDLVLGGPTRSQMIARAIFGRLGLPESRVEVTQPREDQECMDDCTPDKMKVEIGLAKEHLASASH